MRRAFYIGGNYEVIVKFAREWYDHARLRRSDDGHLGRQHEPTQDYSPIYYDGRGVGYEFSRTSKLKPNLPTVVVQIPFELLGVYETVLFDNKTISVAIADSLLREFGEFFEEPNRGLENRSRPVTENGRFYVARPGGEVLERNSGFIARIPMKDYENSRGRIVCILPEEKRQPPKLCFCVRMQIQLPEKSDAKTLKKIARMLCGTLPNTVGAFIDRFDREKLEKSVRLAKLQAQIRFAETRR